MGWHPFFMLSLFINVTQKILAIRPKHSLSWAWPSSALACWKYFQWSDSFDSIVWWTISYVSICAARHVMVYSFQEYTITCFTYTKHGGGVIIPWIIVPVYKKGICWCFAKKTYQINLDMVYNLINCILISFYDLRSFLVLYLQELLLQLCYTWNKDIILLWLGKGLKAEIFTRCSPLFLEFFFLKFSTNVFYCFKITLRNKDFVCLFA